jgi:hypothetical protein
MKNTFWLLAFTASILISINASGQVAIDSYWGPLGPNGSHTEKMFWLGKNMDDTTGHLVLRINGALDIYGDDLHKRGSQQLIKLNRDSEIFYVSHSGKKAFIVAYERKSIAKLYTFAYADKSAAYEKDIISSKIQGELSVSLSPDSSKILFTLVSTGKQPLASFYVFDSLFKPLWENADMPVLAAPLAAAPIVSNNGIVSFAETDKENFTIRVISDKGKKHSPFSLPLAGSKPANAASAASPCGGFIYAQLYNRENINYSCIEKMQLAWITPEGTMGRHAITALETCLDNRLAVGMHHLSGDSFCLVTELFSSNRQAASNQNTYGSFNLFGISASVLGISWSQELFKNLYFVSGPDIAASPLSAEYAALYGHGAFNYKGALYLVYNDNCQNTSNATASPRSHSAIRTSCLSMASIAACGKLLRHTHASLPKQRYEIGISSMVELPGGEFLINSAAGQTRLGKVKLNR